MEIRVSKVLLVLLGMGVRRVTKVPLEIKDSKVIKEVQEIKVIKVQQV